MYETPFQHTIERQGIKLSVMGLGEYSIYFKTDHCGTTSSHVFFYFWAGQITTKQLNVMEGWLLAARYVDLGEEEPFRTSPAIG